jgi:hypothetical protein
MLSPVVYDQDQEPDDGDDDCNPARQLALFAAVAVAALACGLALGFLLDFLQGRL